MTDAQSEAEHILSLSRELLDDIELDRIASDKLLLKASRLARLAGSEEIRKWISFEMQGYSGSDDLALRYMTLTGRWTDYEAKKGYWGPLAQQEAAIETQKARIEATKLGSMSGENMVFVVDRLNRSHSALSASINQMSGVRSRVLGMIHNFVSGVYYERQFADVAATTFEAYKKEVDALIAESAGDVLVKIPSVIARLREKDEEAVSQALTTCRRILEGFADAIFPPSDETYELGGNTLSLDASKHQNRINVYIALRTESSSRRTRLRQNISNLFDRVSTGVHKEVTAEEAYSLFLNVYLFLGEVLNLGAAVSDEIEVC
ncbi:AbiTii domain-containing protein [Novosphingobium beihaiensis]|uniref:AbiTii domain-containing protein n=1 Tax=Novosphingobium beihaiensis TaxID=2930389 RepID=A0ABT0BW24_9SPHN|nr:hypothetical protein [Novosphingobium beihaiensis]MCJ2189257.1 hypothetical protein [Novosphingobium beihaiensis]